MLRFGETNMTEEELTRIFAKLGASEPESWAGSQVREGIPQLARFVFLRQAWRLVVPEGDDKWIERELKTDPSGPGGAIVPALQRLLKQGAGSEDLTTVVRVMQWHLLFHLTYLLEDPGHLEDEVKDMEWCLVQLDSDGNPLCAIHGLHESVLDTDPTGREMMPPKK
jgi:hypothetical protein